MIMDYQEFLKKESFSKEELIAFAFGRLIDNAPGELLALPAPPFLMLDRVTSIKKEGVRGSMLAEKDVHLDEWFFQCHFRNDPVQPGCLGVDAIWQLLGLYLASNGSLGTGRALGCKEVIFDGQIRPHNKLIQYEIDIRRYVVVQEGNASLVVGTGRVLIDGELIYTIKDAKVGAFKGIAYRDYPFKSENSLGGIMEREG